MKMLNAFTLEVDDEQAAVAEILEQLDLENSLAAHSAAFVTCSYDFVESGIVGAICRALPFEVVGCTTLTNAMHGQAGPIQLCLSVLTGDDCEFSCVLTESVAENPNEATLAAWQEAVARLSSPPRLVLAFGPMLTKAGGEIIHQAIDRAAGQIPVFGITACDFDVAKYSNSFTIYNGTCSREGTALLLVGGNVEPRFASISVSREKFFKQEAVITASEGSTLKAVNNMSAREFLQSVGLGTGNGVEGLSCVPFIVDYKGGRQRVSRAIYMLTDEGYAVCGGAMPEGSVLRVAVMDAEAILQSARELLEQVTAAGGLNGLILFPCLGRNMMLPLDPLAEIAVVEDLVGVNSPWHLAYSGGEMCPVSDGETTANHFHNYSFVACAF